MFRKKNKRERDVPEGNPYHEAKVQPDTPLLYYHIINKRKKKKKKRNRRKIPGELVGGYHYRQHFQKS